MIKPVKILEIYITELNKYNTQPHTHIIKHDVNAGMVLIYTAHLKSFPIYLKLGRKYGREKRKKICSYKLEY